MIEFTSIYGWALTVSVCVVRACVRACVFSVCVCVCVCFQCVHRVHAARACERQNAVVGSLPGFLLSLQVGGK